MLGSTMREAIRELKHRGRVQSNLYNEDLLEHVDEVTFTGKTMLLSYEDHGVIRLYYYSLDLSDISEAVNRLSPNEYIVELMTRNPEENRTLLVQAGFAPLTGLMRMSVRDCSVAFQNPQISCFYDAAIGQYPDETDAEAINQVLWHVFDTRVSHLRTDEEIAAAIQRREITVYRDEHGCINAVLQAVVNPRKFYINQVYNGAEKRIIHAMLLNRLKAYNDAGGQYAYAWVAKDNIASLKFHGKYGFTHDGMWNMVYHLEKQRCCSTILTV